MKTNEKSKFLAYAVIIAAFLCAGIFVFNLLNKRQWTPDVLEKGLTAYETGDFKQAFNCFNAGDVAGDPQSSFVLGALYLNGLGVERNVEKAENLYIKSAKNGYVPAMTTLAFLYAGGDLIPQNIEAAYTYMAEAAAKNDREAQITLGTWYENGFLGKKDTLAAVKWYTKAARNGDKNAKMALALIYREGKGLVAPNIFTSKRWYDSIEKQSVYEKRFKGEGSDISK